MTLLPEDEIVEGVQGGKIEFELALVDEDGRPVDTTAYDQYKVCIKLSSSSALEISQVANANGSIMTKVGSDELGVFKVLINPADSANLQAKEGQDIDFEMSEAADATNIQRLKFENKLSIDSTACS